MSKGRTFTAEDLERMGMIQVEPGVYQKLHTPVPRKKQPILKTPDDSTPKSPAVPLLSGIHDPGKPPPGAVVSIDYSKIPAGKTPQEIMQHFKNTGVMIMEYRIIAPMYVFNIIPMGKPRMNKSDFFGKKRARPVALRYFAWCDQMRELASAMNFVIMERMHIVFFLPISNAERKRGVKDGDPYKKKPDKDNMEKAFNDALTSKRYAKRNTVGDEHIWDTRITKRYSDNPRIEVQSLQD